MLKFLTFGYAQLLFVRNFLQQYQSKSYSIHVWFWKFWNLVHKFSSFGSLVF